MVKTRFQKAKANMITTLLYQLVTVVCGILIPKVMIGSFGSQVYGATTSITQFLAYITLLEGGIGGVARAELYRPLSEGNISQVSKIYNGVCRWFKIIGFLFLGYTVILACTYNKIADVDFFAWDYTFWLVVVISISTAAQYFFGIAKLTLLNADQKRYISNLVMIVTTAVNAVLVIVLVKLDCDIMTVKLCSSSIFVLRPILFSVYVRKHYAIEKNQQPDKNVLKQKWTGLGQHLAYYLHSNTDIVVLTVLADVTQVAVYAVYNMVVSSIRNIVTALTGGMEAVFGDMIAKNEKQSLQTSYKYYEMLISCATVVLFGTAGILILPFVKLYTEGVTDAQYIQPAFAFILLMAEAINCLFLPCSTLPVAANRFRQTKWGAYGEAAINVISSCILVLWNPLVGVALGTVLSVLYKNVFYFIYVYRHILQMPVKLGKNYLFNLLLLVAVVAGGYSLVSCLRIESMLQWAFLGCLVVGAVALVVFAFYGLIYGKQFVALVKKLLGKVVKSK